jgi:hypothetical protein
VKRQTADFIPAKRKQNIKPVMIIALCYAVAAKGFSALFLC